MLHARATADAAPSRKSKLRRTPRTSPSIFIISEQNKQLCKWSLKVTHSADFRWSSFKRPLCPLCVCGFFFLINQAKATGEASLSVIFRQEMNGYWELCPGLLYPVSSEDSYHWRGERQRQIRSPLRNSSGILTSDSQNTAVSVYSLFQVASKFFFFFPSKRHATESGWMRQEGREKKKKKNQ